MFSKCMLCFLIVLTHFVAAEPHVSAAQAAHQPPILTTTAIIEIYNQGQLQGVVLIERGKAPIWQSAAWRQGLSHIPRIDVILISPTIGVVS